MRAFKIKNRQEQKLESLMGYPELLQILLWNRGIKNNEEAEIFLNPDYKRDLHDPFLLPDMEKAVKRIFEAIEKKEKIVIYSDYDADGIPGGVILYDFFNKINYSNFINYIPHRHNEGFGLNIEAINKFQTDGVNLIITIDCGINNLMEIALAKKCNIDVIVTDHHEPSDSLPNCLAIIDAKRKDSLYPFRELCGAGIAFKLVQALLTKIKDKSSHSFFKKLKIIDGWEKWLLDMVGIATLSDMVPLLGENRALAFYGLKVLKKSPRIGLIKLFRLLKMEQKNITEDDIGFSISPRINAASRMGSPDQAFKLFIAKTDQEADLLAKDLDHINNERKGTVASLVKEIRKIMEERYGDVLNHKVIVIGNPDWKPSLLGLVANSLVDEHNRPVFLWGRDGGDILKGSCRGDGCISVINIMNEVETGILSDFGGHSMSGGFSIVSEHIHLLEEKLQMAYEKVSIKAQIVNEEIKADALITLDQVNSENYRLIEKLAPFGIGNIKPLFLFEKVRIEGVKTFGKENNHLELIFKNSHNKIIKAIGFFMALSFSDIELKTGLKINLLANFEKSTFRGFAELRLRIVDLEIVL